MGLTNRCSQPLALLMSSFQMTSTHTMQFTLAPANGGGACVSLDLMHRASLALLLVIVTCAPVTLWSAPPDFTSAQSVEAFRVAPRSERNKTTGISFREQKVIAGPRLLSRASSGAIAEQLRRIYGRDPAADALYFRRALRTSRSSRPGDSRSSSLPPLRRS